MEDSGVHCELEGQIDVGVGNLEERRQLQVSAGHSEGCLSGTVVLGYTLMKGNLFHDEITWSHTKLSKSRSPSLIIIF